MIAILGIEDRVHIMVDISDDTQIVRRHAEVTGVVRRRRWNDGRVHLGGVQIFNDRSRFAVGRVTALLGMNGYEHVAHLAYPGCRHMAEDVPIKMNHAAILELVSR